MGFLAELLVDVAVDIIESFFDRAPGDGPEEPQKAPGDGPGCQLWLTPRIIDNSGNTPFYLNIRYWRAVSIIVEIPELLYTEGMPESRNRVPAEGRWSSGTAEVKFADNYRTERLKIYPARGSKPRKYDVTVTVTGRDGKTDREKESVEIRENRFMLPARDWDPGRGTRFGPVSGGETVLAKGRTAGGYRTGTDYVLRSDRTVYAFGCGTVRKAGPAGKSGKAVIIAMEISGRQVYACYTGLEKVSVRERDTVRPGGAIGTAALSGTDGHEYVLHFLVADTFRASAVYPEYADRMEGSTVRQGRMTFYDPEGIIRSKGLPDARN